MNPLIRSWYAANKLPAEDGNDIDDKEWDALQKNLNEGGKSEHWRWAEMDRLIKSGQQFHVTMHFANSKLFALAMEDKAKKFMLRLNKRLWGNELPYSNPDDWAHRNFTLFHETGSAPHYHGSIRICPRLLKKRTRKEIEKIARSVFRSVSGRGTFHCDWSTERKWSVYCTKQYLREGFFGNRFV